MPPIYKSFKTLAPPNTVNPPPEVADIELCELSIDIPARETRPPVEKFKLGSVLFISKLLIVVVVDIKLP